ncbi:bifunctional diguanylate cyclase/phosphodiesterase [Psychrobacillus sp. OK032]|uniref:sensor domain-containing protein n=1 Tax=Psychrobacillus sp. OK032 TaxID=1884358 RepID=UPI0008C59D01|nr:sensor domain-containing diguanylate cyclase [Psychrobacillus sp. OK032]SES13490.1 PAS domain S-box-containing protein/diguanylate cyclase (GGDEF) domain-containing protein [Psychrobacillus sp. OK032]
MKFNNTNEAIFTIGYDGRILSANPSFTDILGWDETDVGEDNCFPFFTDISPEEHEQQLSQFKQGMDIPYYVTKRKRKDGEVLDILASYRAINNGEVLAVGMYKDFTEQMNIQRRLQASEDCYRNLVEFIPDAIFVENNGKIVFVNSPGIDLVGAKSIKDVLGQSVWQFIKTNEHTVFSRKVQQVISTKEPIIEQLLRLDGETIWVEIIAMSIIFEGETVIQVLLRDVTSKKNYEAQLEFLAFHDPLTGLSNRRYFAEQINQAIEQAENVNQMLALMYIDIDKFKSINDTLGHDVGDQLLKQFANRLKENVRDEDILCRIGGDEFLVLLNGLKEKKTVLEIVSRLHKAFQVPYLIDNQKIVVTSSIGIAMFPEDGINSKILISRSDAALYLAKEQRNVFQFYEIEKTM